MVLMLQRANKPFENYWVLPGGFIGYSETTQEAALREAKEETGMNIGIERLIGAYRIDNDPRGVHIDIIYSGVSNNEVTLSKEHVSWKYFSPQKLPKLIAYKHREAIHDWGTNM